MKFLIAQLEKAKPFFEKVSRNIYLRAVKDGFIAGMPVILFSSIFLLIAFVPNIFGLEWSEKTISFLMKPYNYTMGILALLLAATTAKSLTDAINRKLAVTNRINYISTMLAASSSLLILASDPIDGGFSMEFLGTKGLLSAFIAAFIIVNIYRLCVKNNVTIKMPREVPPNISQVFADLIPFALSLILIYALDILIRKVSGGNAARAVSLILAPLFKAADGYVGITLIFGAYALFWFVGIHGPSIVEPAVAAILYANVESNFLLFQAGEHANKILTTGTQYFIVTMGGTGATLVVPFMFMYLTKSKRNKAIGRASFIPTFFGVNEPILFGAPLVLNPTFFIPFVFAPIANVWIFKFFVDVLGMHSFSVNLPWTTPGPLGIIMGTGFGFFSFILAALLLVVDVVIYYPFLKVYDEEILEEERRENVSGESENKMEKKSEVKKSDEILKEALPREETKNKEINVLVICAGGGTSGLLAAALNKAGKGHGIKAQATSYGAHREMMPSYQLVILAPQVASNYADIKTETDALGIKLIKTEGKQYIALTRDSEAALRFIREQME